MRWRGTWTCWRRVQGCLLLAGWMGNRISPSTERTGTNLASPHWSKCCRSRNTYTAPAISHAVHVQQASFLSNVIFNSASLVTPHTPAPFLWLLISVGIHSRWFLVSSSFVHSYNYNYRETYAEEDVGRKNKETHRILIKGRFRCLLQQLSAAGRRSPDWWVPSAAVGRSVSNSAKRETVRITCIKNKRDFSVIIINIDTND